jgi:hypothetical protein
MEKLKIDRSSPPKISKGSGSRSRKKKWTERIHGTVGCPIGPPGEIGPRGPTSREEENFLLSLASRDKVPKTENSGEVGKTGSSESNSEESLESIAPNSKGLTKDDKNE